MKQVGNGTVTSMYGLEGKNILKKKHVITQCFLLEQLLELDFLEFEFLQAQYRKDCVSLHCSVMKKGNRKAQSLQLAFKHKHSHTSKS